jgi:hypothetical protein
MSAKLIYHTPASSAGDVSPFDVAITEMSEGQDVCIACPYLGLSYLRRIVERASSWRLLTDVEEWLFSHGGESRTRIADYILGNGDRIRHCKDLHAKVIIAGERALTGSTNLTEKGITERVEMSVLFDSCEQVAELRAWFDLLWEGTAPVTEADLRSCLSSMPHPSPSPGGVPLPCLFPKVSARLCPLDPVGGDPGAEDLLVERLKLAPDRAWAESYLEMARELVEIAGLTGDDPRLVMSIPQGKALPITINRRYVLAAFRKNVEQHEPSRAVLELILPAAMEDRIDELPDVIGYGPFRPGFAGETADNVPLFVTFSAPSRFDFPPDVLEGWREAVLSERDRGHASNFRKYHEPAFYRAVVDLSYRRRLLDLAFPGGPLTA